MTDDRLIMDVDSIEQIEARVIEMEKSGRKALILCTPDDIHQMVSKIKEKDNYIDLLQVNNNGISSMLIDVQEDCIRAEKEAGELKTQLTEARAQTSEVAKILAHFPPYQASLAERVRGVVNRAVSAEAQVVELKKVLREAKLFAEMSGHAASHFLGMLDDAIGYNAGVKEG